MLSVSALALGYLVQNLFSSSANISGDVCSTLFGSTLILTLSTTDVWVCVGMSIVVMAIFLLFYHKIFAVTFDETFAAATGIRARMYNLLIAVVTAVIIVLAMNLVGSLLTSALIVFPALSAMRLFRSFRGVICCAGVISVVALLIPLHTLDFLGNVLGVHVVHNGPEGSDVVGGGIHAGVDAVQQGDVAHPLLREIAFHVVARHDIVTSQPGQVLGNDHVDLLGLDVGNHPLEIRAVKAGA